MITLVRNPDILADTVAIARRRGAGRDLPPLIVGFAAETGDAESGVLEYGAAKLARKGCDMLVVNEVGENLTFGTDENSVTILFADGAEPVHARRVQGPGRRRSDRAVAAALDADAASRRRSGWILGRTRRPGYAAGSCPAPGRAQNATWRQVRTVATAT